MWLKAKTITHLSPVSSVPVKKKNKRIQRRLCWRGSALETLWSRIFPHCWFVLWPGCFEDRIFYPRTQSFLDKDFKSKDCLLKILVWIDHVFHLVVDQVGYSDLFLEVHARFDKKFYSASTRLSDGKFFSRNDRNFSRTSLNRSVPVLVANNSSQPHEKCQPSARRIQPAFIRKFTNCVSSLPQ